MFRHVFVFPVWGLALFNDLHISTVIFLDRLMSVILIFPLKFRTRRPEGPHPLIARINL